VLRHSGKEYEVMEFSPYGYDERQYCSPGFNLPIGCLSRTPHGRYPEYHTSADDLSFVQPCYLVDSFQKCFSIFAVLENDRTYLNLNPKGEPQLGRRGIYRAIGGQNAQVSELAMLWVLNLSDGNHSLLQIAEQSDLPFQVILNAARILCEHELLKEIPSQQQ
jgi:aminopeptidase-like protein